MSVNDPENNVYQTDDDEFDDKEALKHHETLIKKDYNVKTDIFSSIFNVLVVDLTVSYDPKKRQLFTKEVNTALTT